MLKALQVEAGDDWQRFKRQLLCGLAVAAAGRAFDFGGGSEMFSAGEALQASRERTGSGHVQADVPERVNGSGHSMAWSTYDVALQTAREYLVDDTVAATVLLLLSVFVYAVHAMSEKDKWHIEDIVLIYWKKVQYKLNKYVQRRLDKNINFICLSPLLNATAAF